MAGQRKRRRQREREAREATERADRFGPDAGHWEVVFSTRDETEWHAELRRMRAENPTFDREAARVDILCGRLRHPTTHRLSVFVPKAG